MKKFAVLFLTMFVLLAMTACGNKAIEVKVDYGSSSVYSKEDMDKAITAIKKEFATWNGCELHSISYAGDSCVTDENIKWMNDLVKNKDYTQCIEFKSSFHAPKNGGGAWEADKEYENYEWWLARKDGGEWDLLTWGY